MAMSGASGKRFAFPMVEIADILEFCRQWYGEQLSVVDTDFKQPVKARWHRIYQCILEDITGVTPDILNQHHLAARYELEYPEMHENAIPLFSLTLAMQRIMSTCGVDDFAVSDIVDPKPRRCMRIMSAVMNYMYFRQERLAEYDQIKQKNDTLLEQRDSLSRSVQDIQQRINTIKATRAEKQPEIDQLNAAYADLQTEMGQRESKRKDLQKTSNDVKSINAEKRNVNARIKEQVMRMKEDNLALSQQIVQSPERVKGDIERMEKHLVQQKQGKADRCERLQELGKQSDAMSKREDEFDQALKLLNNVQAEFDKTEKYHKDVADTKDHIQTKQEELKDLSSTEGELNWKMKANRDKLAKLTLRHNNKMAAMEEEIRELERRKKELEENVGEKDEHASNLRRQRLAVEKLMIEEQQQYETKKEQWGEAITQAMKALDKYHARLGTAWDKLEVAAKQG